MLDHAIVFKAGEGAISRHKTATVLVSGRAALKLAKASGCDVIPYGMVNRDQFLFVSKTPANGYLHCDETTSARDVETPGAGEIFRFLDKDEYNIPDEDEKAIKSVADELGVYTWVIHRVYTDDDDWKPRVRKLAGLPAVDARHGYTQRWMRFPSLAGDPVSLETAVAMNAARGWTPRPNGSIDAKLMATSESRDFLMISGSVLFEQPSDITAERIARDEHAADKWRLTVRAWQEVE